MKSFAIGQSEHPRIEIEVHGYERPVSGDQHDDNWLNVRVAVAVGAFYGTFSAAFLTAELVGFADDVKRLHQSLKGGAIFSTVEDQLHLELKGNGLGNIEVTGSATDDAGLGNCLQFRFDIDQTHLASSLGELDDLIRAFPVRIA
jgi:hypothetical protein